MTHSFSADHPISSCSEDLLGRSGFAKSLASTIRHWTGKDSLVIALYGVWGSGKSSLKNLVLESLQKSEECPLIVEFNPWQWASQDQLTEAFFREIGIRFGQQDTSEKYKKLAAKWKLYGASLKVSSLLLTSIPKTIIWLLTILGAVGVTSLCPSGERA